MTPKELIHRKTNQPTNQPNYQLKIKSHTQTHTLINVYRHHDLPLKVIYTQTYMYLKIKLAFVVEGDPKAPFSIATTPRCKGGRYSFPWISPLYS